MLNTITSAIVALAVSVGGWFGIQQAIPQSQPQTFGAFGDPFVSLQLATDPDSGECLTTDGTNNIWDTCASGGGASGGTWSTTTSSVAGVLFNYPNNTDDVVLVGSNSSTTAEFIFDPNTNTYKLGGAGTTTGFAITGQPSGILKTNATGGVEKAVAGTDYENIITAGDGLTRTANDFDCDTASGTTFGCLSSANWTTFNNKQAAGNYITALTGDVTASGPGSVASTLATVNSNVGSFTNANITVNGKGLITAASNGTDNTASTTLLANNNTFSGNNTFSNIITGSITGNAGTATALAANGTNCSAGSYARGVDASGNAENCTVDNAGTVTAVSVASANGFAGSSSGGATPALTLSTTISGLLKGNGTAISAATANTDYQSPISLTTTGSSGAASFDGTTLNIPQYSGGAGAAYPFNVTGNATSTLTQFNGGLTAFASSTIGNGSSTGGLTISGNATTTGSFYLPRLGTAAGSFIAVDANGKLIATTSPSSSGGGGTGTTITVASSTTGTLSVTTGATDTILVTAKGYAVISSAAPFTADVLLNYNSIQKDKVTVGGDTDTLDFYVPFALTYTEVPGAATHDITVTSSQTIASVVITAQIITPGTGGGGGEGTGGTWSTTASTVSGRLINSPLNNTDIVAVGNSSTTTAPFYFDPNTFTSLLTGTTTLLGDVRIGSVTGNDNKVRIVADRVFNSTNSVGGTVNITNTNNTGPGLVVYTNNGGTSSGNLVNFRCDNAAMAHDCTRIDNDGTGDALAVIGTAASSNAISASNTGTDHTLNVAYTGTTAAKGAANFTSTNILGSVFQVTGSPVGLGVFKSSLTAGTNDSSAGSFDASGSQGQGLFVKGNAGTTTAIFNALDSNSATAFKVDGNRLTTMINASSTQFSTSYASSTQYFGAGLTACNASNKTMSWASGVFGCNDILVAGTVGGNPGQVFVTNGLGSAVWGQVDLADATNAIKNTLSVAHGGTGSTTLTGILKGNTTSQVQTAVAGTDYLAPTSNIKIYPAFTISTTTAWTGTTTIPLGTAYVDETWNGVQCYTDTGTLNVYFSDGTNRMNMFNASTTVGTVTLSTNNTFTAGEKRDVSVGTPASSPKSISCTLSKTQAAN